MMNFISNAITNFIGFISERGSALGITAKFICFVVIALFFLNAASDYYINCFYRKPRNCKHSIKLVAGYILANLAMLGITAFIICKVAFTFCYGLSVIVPLAITILLIAESVALIALDMSRFVYTFRLRYMSTGAK